VFVLAPLILLVAGLVWGLTGTNRARQAPPPAPAIPVVTLPPAVPSTINDVSSAGLDAYIQAKMKVAHVPGLAAGVVHDGEVVWAKGFGWADIARRRPVTPDTGFMLASISKTFIATAVMQQVEAGNLSLSADVGAYLPFPVRNPRHPDDPITLYQLLTHTSSVRDHDPVWDDLYTYGHDSAMSLDSFLEGYLTPGGILWNARDYSRFAPGRKYDYSNVGADLAAYVVEAATGVPFDQYCATHVFAPLGMNTTSYKLEGLDRGALAMPYRYVSGSGKYRAYGHYSYPDYPCGQARTSVSQLGRFLASYTSGGTYHGVRLLKPATVAEILRPQIGALYPGQGLIWYREKVGGPKVLGHQGGDSGVCTFMFFDQKTGDGAIVLTNSDVSTWKQWYAVEDVFAKLIAEAPRLQPGTACCARRRC